MKLRDYQQRAIDMLWAYLAASDGIPSCLNITDTEIIYRSMLAAANKEDNP